MIQKQTLIVPSDRSGVWVASTIHTYSKLSNHLLANNFGKISVREASPGSWLKNNSKNNFLYTRSSVLTCRLCGVSLHTHKSNLLLKKRLTPVGSQVIGFAVNELRRNRAIASFINIL